LCKWHAGKCLHAMCNKRGLRPFGECGSRVDRPAVPNKRGCLASEFTATPEHHPGEFQVLVFPLAGFTGMFYSIARFSGKVFSLVGFLSMVFSLVGLSDRVCSVAKLSSEVFSHVGLSGMVFSLVGLSGMTFSIVGLSGPDEQTSRRAEI